MAIERFYCKELSESLDKLTGSEARHISGARRLGPGDNIELFDGKGGFARAIITETRKKMVGIRVTEIQHYNLPKHPRIIISAAVAKSNRFEKMISGCTELGVDRICPVIFERTVKQPGNPKIFQRWNKIAIEAAKQSGRLFVPEIGKPMSPKKVIEDLKFTYKSLTMFYGSLQNGIPNILDIEGLNDNVAVFIGPEGGFTNKEIEIFNTAGVKPVGLGTNILRIETAGLAFSSILTVWRAKRLD